MLKLTFARVQICKSEASGGGRTNLPALANDVLVAEWQLPNDGLRMLTVYVNLNQARSLTWIAKVEPYLKLALLGWHVYESRNTSGLSQSGVGKEREKENSQTLVV